MQALKVTGPGEEEAYRPKEPRCISLRCDDVIVLVFPDGTVRRLKDDEAERLAGILWDMAQSEPTATVAAAIQVELPRAGRLSRTVEVPQRNAPRVVEALAQLP